MRSTSERERNRAKRQTGRRLGRTSEAGGDTDGTDVQCSGEIGDWGLGMGSNPEERDLRRCFLAVPIPAGGVVAHVH